jgi:hypothetical protein
MAAAVMPVERFGREAAFALMQYAFDGLRCKNNFEVRKFFNRISSRSNLKQRSNELRLSHRIISS